jgi:N-acetylglutamate synthase-like GNAT family acetyltransferase
MANGASSDPARRQPSGSSSVFIRRAAAGDAAAIKALIDRYVGSGALLPRTAAFIADHAHDFTVAADERGSIIGCVHLEEYAPSLAEIRSLTVAPDWQNHGVGRALVAAAERLARIRSYATVFAVSNVGEFFTALGYQPRDIPELNRERSAISKFKGVYAKDMKQPPTSRDPARRTGWNIFDS